MSSPSTPSKLKDQKPSNVQFFDVDDPKIVAKRESYLRKRHQSFIDPVGYSRDSSGNAPSPFAQRSDRHGGGPSTQYPTISPIEFSIEPNYDELDWPSPFGDDKPGFFSKIFGRVFTKMKQIALGERPGDIDRKKGEVLPDGISVEGIAKKILRGDCKKIVVMSGAGLSTAAGIPDFRSPNAGLYHSLMEYNVPRPESLLTREYFDINPKPFFHLVKGIYPGTFKPTKAHYFIRLLNDKGMLKKCYTQNIDTLERLAGLDSKSVVEVHGSFASARCTAKDCGREAEEEQVRRAVFQDRVPHCHTCNGIIKPDIVMFGEPLPQKFFKHRDKDFSSCDLLIVMGTSLTVEPFASCIGKVGEYVPRLLINNQIVGTSSWKQPGGFQYNAEENYRDVAVIGTCDEGVQKLVDCLGWTEEFRALVDGKWKEWEDQHAYIASETRKREEKVMKNIESGSERKPQETGTDVPLQQGAILFESSTNSLPIPTENGKFVEYEAQLVRKQSGIILPTQSQIKMQLDTHKERGHDVKAKSALESTHSSPKLIGIAENGELKRSKSTGIERALDLTDLDS